MSFEYKIDTYNRMQRSASTVEEDMNELGSQGWEMVSAAIEANTIMVVYKRIAKAPEWDIAQRAVQKIVKHGAVK
jgi:hypothetical protein